jgi:hypothetical protein
MLVMAAQVLFLKIGKIRLVPFFFGGEGLFNYPWRSLLLSTSSSHKTISVASFNRVRTHTICLHIEEYRPLRIHILALAKRCARIGQTRQIKRVPGSTNSSELRHIRFLSSVVTIPYVVHKDDDISKPSESRSIARVETHSRVPKERLAAMPF